MADDRLAHLEMLIMEHEQTIESLSTTLHHQQLSIQQLHDHIRVLEARLSNMHDSPIKPLEEEVPPPHY